MEVQGRITMLYPEVSGQSAKTGNMWHRRDFLMEQIEENGKKNIFPLMTFNDESLSKLGKAQEGDLIRVDLGFDNDVQHYKDKTTGEQRTICRPSIFVRSLDLVEEPEPFCYGA